MTIPLREFAHRDIYIDYSFEEVTYRWECQAKALYVRFYGSDESPEPVRQDSRLFNEAVLYGKEITLAEYAAGYPRR